MIKSWLLLAIVVLGFPAHAGQFDSINGHKWTAASSSPAESEELDIRQAEWFLRQRDYGRAFMILDKLVQGGSHNFWAYAYRAKCLEEMGDHNGALKDYFKAIALNPQTGKKLYRTIAFIYWEEGLGTEAQAWFQEYLKNFPGDAESYFGMALAQYDLHDYTGALESLDAAQHWGYNRDLGSIRQKILAAHAKAEALRAQEQAVPRPVSSIPLNSPEHSNKEAYTIFVIFCLGFGVCFLLFGLIALGKNRLNVRVPLSTVHGLALGLAEVHGRARKAMRLKAPLTGAACVFYRYTIERKETGRTSGGWAMVVQEDSAFCPFVLKDETGELTLIPRESELAMDPDYTFTTGEGLGLPDNLAQYIQRNGLQLTGPLGGDLRFQEWHIRPDDALFVVATAQINSSQLNKNKEDISKRLEELKQKVLHTMYLSRQDGISAEEWVRTAANEEHRLLLAESQSDPKQNASDVLMLKGKDNPIFILSDQSQTQASGRLLRRALVCIGGGAAISLAALVYLIKNASL